MNKSIYVFYGLILLLLNVSCMNKSGTKMKELFIPAQDERFYYVARHLETEEGVMFSFPGSAINAKFTGSTLSLYIKDFSEFIEDEMYTDMSNYLLVTIDDVASVRLRLKPDQEYYPITNNLKRGMHKLSVVKLTESVYGPVLFKGIGIEQGKIMLEYSPKQRRILFFGNSITSGYGVEAKSELVPANSSIQNAYMSYASVAGRLLHAECQLIAYSGKGLAKNNDGSKFNTIPDFSNLVFPENDSVRWDTSKFKPDVICLNLGTNDYFAGIEDSVFISTGVSFIDSLRKSYNEIPIILMLGPMLNDDEHYGGYSRCKKSLTEISRLSYKNGQKGVHFFELSQQDGSLGYGSNKHPSIEQQQKNGEELAAFIKQLLEW